MDRTEISNTLKCFIESWFPSQGMELHESTNLLEDWFVDSLGIMETAFFMESTFGIKISRADVNGENFESITTLTEFVTGRLKP